MKKILDKVMTMSADAALEAAICYLNGAGDFKSCSIRFYIKGNSDEYS